MSEKGFTLIEMLIVLTIITVLILLIIPNIADNSKIVYDRGCDALVKTVQAQVSAYELAENKQPTSIGDLLSKGFITEDQETCKNGKSLDITDGVVTVQ